MTAGRPRRPREPRTGRPTCRKAGRRRPRPPVPTGGTKGLGVLAGERPVDRPMLAVMTFSSFAELDALPTDQLRERAFAAARHNRDMGFFWSVIRHLPDADEAA